ncbi:cystatin-like fold lipoprotein [Bacillus spizizenii]|uniref:cystatin-like fold lipoprotein n=1 Tax=Bacillus spizizenii TaxID=96241 RepID=UPI002029DA8A|nr:cystatin-like fold lipoprotein [Bacillus spizizenii]MED0870028.1 cystatin-like fold lipoprotein [Bacillus spizizenii]MED1071949.1 cystatin-like fold lipoprotein [Bacillus spizizenii]
MKNLFIFFSLLMMFVLTACGGNKYEDAINDVINLEKKTREEMGSDSDKYKRNNALIRVYNNGKYIQLAFYQPEGDSRELTTFSYYEKIGDAYEEMDSMPGNGENDRLGLSQRTPDYEEVKGKETKLEE